MINKVILVGTLGQGPELRYTASGDAVANLTVATNDKSKDKEYTEWHRVVVWRKQAENAAKYLSKGSKVYVEGKLQTRKWEDKGQTKYSTEIHAQTLKFLNRVNQDNVGNTTEEDIPF